MARCLIGFGSNSGDLEKWFAETISQLQGHPRIASVSHSSPIRTSAVVGWTDTVNSADEPKPVAGEQHADYLNSVITIDTELSPRALFELTRQIESDLGRVRSQRWGARTVDLDILLYGDQVIRTKRLQIPHPRMSFRRFVLAGAVEIAADMQHPIAGVTLGALWDRINTGPKKILWLCVDVNATQKRFHDLSASELGATLFGPDSWEVVIVDDWTEINSREFSLLIYSGDPQRLTIAGSWFGGPVLDLTDCVSEFIQREVTAAVEALS